MCERADHKSSSSGCMNNTDKRVIGCQGGGGGVMAPSLRQMYSNGQQLRLQIPEHPLRVSERRQ